MLIENKREKFSLFHQYYLCSLHQFIPINTYTMEIIFVIVPVLVLCSCLTAWFNAAELDTDDENF